MFHRRQPLRRWAALALLLWLFGIGASVAHACLAPQLRTPGHEAPASDAPPCHGAARADADEGVAGKSNCQDFCEKASVSIPPLKVALDDVMGAALLFPAVAAVVPAPAPVPVRAVQPRRDGAAAPPISIAFLRLTL